MFFFFMADDISDIDRDDINKTIKRKGLKKSYIAEQIGITPTTFWKKLSGQAKFTKAELYMLSDILDGRYEQRLLESEQKV